MFVFFDGCFFLVECYWHTSSTVLISAIRGTQVNIGVRVWVKKGYSTQNSFLGKGTNKPKPVVSRRYLFDPEP